MIRLLLSAVASLTVSVSAHAHTLMCECREIADKQVQCTGGFAHGSGASGVTIDVMDYDEKTLVAGKFADDSTFTFKRPDGDFYVLMDMGAGHTLEIDHSKIQAKQ